ncbi:hypothetical protein GCM10010350_70290 [Streptomyces galilaeus]|nr:hypothetical protein GCM10010350_70290 [Streptomyces galilaeus]
MGLAGRGGREEDRQGQGHLVSARDHRITSFHMESHIYARISSNPRVETYGPGAPAAGAGCARSA